MCGAVLLERHDLARPRPHARATTRCLREWAQRSADLAQQQLEADTASAPSPVSAALLVVARDLQALPRPAVLEQPAGEALPLDLQPARAHCETWLGRWPDLCAVAKGRRPAAQLLPFHTLRALSELGYGPRALRHAAR